MQWYIGQKAGKMLHQIVSSVQVYGHTLRLQFSVSNALDICVFVMWCATETSTGDTKIKKNKSRIKHENLLL